MAESASTSSAVSQQGVKTQKRLRYGSRAFLANIKKCEVEKLESLIAYLENRSLENLDKAIQSAGMYGEAIHEDPKVWRDKTKEHIREMLKAPDPDVRLKAWQMIERACKMISRPDLRQRLIAAAEKYGVGSKRWVLEKALS